MRDVRMLSFRGRLVMWSIGRGYYSKDMASMRANAEVRIIILGRVTGRTGNIGTRIISGIIGTIQRAARTIQMAAPGVHVRVTQRAARAIQRALGEPLYFE